MGHFGTRPIRLTWFALVLPALLLNYFGQGALLLHNPTMSDNPFYRLAPDWALYPLVLLATLATVIASQAVISGAFSLTRQAIQLGYSPRMQIQPHLGARDRADLHAADQLVLMLATIGLVVGFRLLEQPRRGLRRRRDHDDGDHHHPLLRRRPRALGLAALRPRRLLCARLPGRRPVVLRRHR